MLQDAAAALESRQDYAIFIEWLRGFVRARQAPRQAIHPQGRVAQLEEHSALNRQVVGSIPTASTKNSPTQYASNLFIFYNL